MIADLRALFPSLLNTPRNFPCIKGCDEYSSRISTTALDTSLFTQTSLVSGDFSDAYTLSQLKRLQDSITTIGQLLKYEEYIVALMINLTTLIFTNSYFFTPFGLYLQGNGYPMGNFSSRDALDLDLVRTEIELLTSSFNFIKCIKDYGRMVDDISTIIQGDFTNTIKIILLMSKKYPTMPLNIQVSFLYSRFLDVHLYNILNPALPTYNLYSTLAWKEMNTFAYQPISSNKHPKYKDTIVSTTMHRIDRRCSAPRDKQHHARFIYRILQHRDQDMNRVRACMLKYKKSSSAKIKRPAVFKQGYKIHFDSSTKTHLFVRKIVESCDSKQLIRPIYVSHATLASLLCPKRSIISRVKAKFQK